MHKSDMNIRKQDSSHLSEEGADSSYRSHKIVGVFPKLRQLSRRPAATEREDRSKRVSNSNYYRHLHLSPHGDPAAVHPV
ncbi:hypothetical protein SLA2020_080810 [Shorea laevis]